MVQGPIRAKDVLLKSQAKIYGDIYCNTLAVEKGAWVDGRLIRVPASNADTTKRLGAALRGNGEAKPTINSVVEARHRSGNPSSTPDETVALVGKGGNGKAKTFLKAHDKEAAGFSQRSKTRLARSERQRCQKPGPTKEASLA